VPNYRRSYIAGGCYFFTVVSYQRLPILTGVESRTILRQALIDVRKRFPFTLDAICLLPEHIHCIWTLPEQDSDYSLRWKEIKRLFTRGYHARVGPGEIRSTSRQERGEAAIWQRRFWEHSIRSDQDLNRHIDYLHYNPVRHGLVKRPVDWPWSSFHRFVKMGAYDKNWGESVSNELLGMACGE